MTEKDTMTNCCREDPLYSEYHFDIQDDHIVCNDGHGNWTKVAKIINARQAKALLVALQLAENIELLMDNYIADTSAPDILVAKRLIRTPPKH